MLMELGSNFHLIALNYKRILHVPYEMHFSVLVTYSQIAIINSLSWLSHSFKRLSLDLLLINLTQLY